MYPADYRFTTWVSLLQNYIGRIFENKPHFGAAETHSICELNCPSNSVNNGKLGYPSSALYLCFLPLRVEKFPFGSRRCQLTFEPCPAKPYFRLWSQTYRVSFSQHSFTHNPRNLHIKLTIL